VSAEWSFFGISAIAVNNFDESGTLLKTSLMIVVNTDPNCMRTDAWPLTDKVVMSNDPRFDCIVCNCVMYPCYFVVISVCILRFRLPITDSLILSFGKHRSKESSRNMTFLVVASERMYLCLDGTSAF